MISEEAQGEHRNPRMRAKIGLDIHSHINAHASAARAEQREALAR